MFPVSAGVPGLPTGQPSGDALEDEPTITEIMKNPSKVSFALQALINTKTCYTCHNLIIV